MEHKLPDTLRVVLNQPRVQEHLRDIITNQVSDYQSQLARAPDWDTARLIQGSIRATVALGEILSTQEKQHGRA